MKPPQTTIIADNREVSSITVQTLQNMAQVDLVIYHLKVGDYLVNHHVLFERKTLTDFVASIKDGRLFLQTA